MFNNYFVNLVKDDNLHDSSKFIYENPMSKDQRKSKKNKVRSEFKFWFVDTMNMEKVMSSMKNNNSFGFDDIPIINVMINKKQNWSEILCHFD